MKTRRHSYLPWVLIVIMLIISQNGCKKDNDNINPDNPPPNQIPKTTKVVKDQDWNQNIVAVDSSDWTLTFKPLINKNYNLKVGDVLLSTEGEGLLRKITEIEEEGGKLIVKTEDATVVDAMPVGRLKFNVDLTQNLDKAKILYLADGVKFNGTRKGKNGRVELTFSLEKEIYDDVTIGGELGLSPSVSGSICWNDGNLDTLILAYTFTESLELTATVTVASLELEKEMKLARVQLPTFTIYAGIPIVVTPVFTLKIGANLELNSEMTIGVTQELSYTTGFSYIEGNTSPICDMDMDLGPMTPELSNTLEAKAYIKPILDMKIYQVISPNLSLEMYGKLDAEVGASPWWKLYAGLSGAAGFKIGKWGFDIVDIKLDIFDYKKLLLDANGGGGGGGNSPPTASFTVTPNYGTIDSIFIFDASGCYDNEDPVEDLEIRWDWDGDSIFDTEYSTNKTITHSYDSVGLYNVSLEVKDSDGLTDKLSKYLVVYNASSGNSCPDVPVFEYGGQIYHTVQIGDQCWMKENLNIGTLITSAQDQKNNNIIEKYCYLNKEENCAIYGGYYQWDELMQYTEEEGARGICPPGWHVPTFDEWSILEGTVDSQYDVGDPEWDKEWYRGYDAGFQLKSTFGWEQWGDGEDGNGIDGYGFTALPAGKALSNGWNGVGRWVGFWTSTISDNAPITTTYVRNIQSWKKKINNMNQQSYIAISVRCIKDQ